MMNWLLWREYRLNRLILAFGAVLILAPYLIAVIYSGLSIVLGDSIDGNFETAAVWSFVITWALMLVLLPSNAIAGERADRSAEFISYLPLLRGRMLASKLLLSLIAFSVLLGINALMLTIFVLFSARPQGVVGTAG